MTLKPCPFCGGEAQTDVGRAGQAAAFCDLFRSYCMDCGTQSPEWSYTEAEAITAWNTRSVNTHDALVKALEGCIPSGVCLTNSNIPDDTIVPIDATMGELRAVAAALALAKGEGE